MRFILFDFQVNKYISLINIFTIATKYDFDKSLFKLWFENWKLKDWDFLFINYIYKRFIKKEF